MVEVLTDPDVRRWLTPRAAVGWMREALLAEHHGHLHSPPRVHADLGEGATRDAPGAVDGADIVVLATSSPTAVIDPAWVAPGAFITTVGPKQVGRAELAPELVAACDLAVTDSVAQISAYDPPNILIGTPHEHRLTSLGAVLSGDTAGRTGEEQRLLFCSVGLAGTEAFLLDRLLSYRRTADRSRPA